MKKRREQETQSISSQIELAKRGKKKREGDRQKEDKRTRGEQQKYFPLNRLPIPEIKKPHKHPCFIL